MALADEPDAWAEDSSEGGDGTLHKPFASVGHGLAELVAPEAGALAADGFQVADPKGCLPFTVQFQNTSTIAATDYRWYFPGGNPSTSIQKNPVVTYNSVGKYNVSLVASNFQYSDSVGYADFIEVKTLPTVNFNNSKWL